MNKRLEKYIRTWVDNSYLEIETSKETMLGCALAYGKSVDHQRTLIELIFVIPYLGVKFKLPRYWFKSEVYHNIKLADDLKHLKTGEKIHTNTGVGYQVRIPNNFNKTVSGYYKYDKTFVVTDVYHNMK